MRNQDMALRIIAGRFKGRKLRSVPGTKTRPTASRIREAIFNILAGQVRGARVLDLFAGTGAFGVEALSRGAESVFFIDIDSDSIAVLKDNIKSISLENHTRILKWDPTKNLNCLRSWRPAFNLVFMDPPYNKNLIAATLQNLHNSESMESGTRIVLEHSRQEPIPKDKKPFILLDQRRYGKTLVSFFKYML
jgi:16S rRNA (guanine966-N2)-methyltransferase